MHPVGQTTSAETMLRYRVQYFGLTRGLESPQLRQASGELQEFLERHPAK